MPQHDRTSALALAALLAACGTPSAADDDGSTDDTGSSPEASTGPTSSPTSETTVADGTTTAEGSTTADPGTTTGEPETTDDTTTGEPEPEPDPRTRIEIPIPGFFPEGVAIAQDGTFYVGSVVTGEVVRALPGEVEASSFLAPEQVGNIGVAGMTLDEDRDRLWLCAIDFLGVVTGAGGASALYAFDRDDGTLVRELPLPAGGFCNDVIVDAEGRAYATDSFLGQIYVAAPDDGPLDVWIADPAFVAANPMPGAPPVALNGIAWDGASSIYAGKLDSGEVFRIELAADGSAGAPELLAITPALPAVDGLEVAADGSLYAVGFGSLRRVELDGRSGTASDVWSSPDVPTTLGLYDGSAWVVLSQFDDLFTDPTAASLPFVVERVALP